MENAAKTTVDKSATVNNYPIDFLIIGPKENDQLDIIFQGSSEDRDYYSFDKNAVLVNLQRRVTEWGNPSNGQIGSGQIDIGQHISNQYTDYVLSKPNTSLVKDATQMTTTVKSGQALNINTQDYDNYFYVWYGKVNALDRNKIQKEFTQQIPDIVNSLEQENEAQVMQHLNPIVTMSIDATKVFAKRTKQTNIARVIFISLAIVLLLVYVSFKKELQFL